MSTEQYGVKLTADISGFNKGLSNAIKTGTSFLNIADRLEESGSKISDAFNFGAFASVGAKAVQAITNAVSSLNSTLSDSTAAWKTFESNMSMNGHTVDEIENTKQALQDFASKTVYSASDMASTFAQLDAVGVKNCKDVVTGLGGIAAASSDPAQAMKSLSTQLTQAAGKATITYQDFKIMLEQSPAGIAQVAKALGKTTSQLVSDVQDGTVATEDFINAISEAGNGSQLQSMATQFKTVDQAIDGMKEALANNLTEAFGNLQTAGITAITSISNALDKMTPILNGIISGVTGLVEIFNGVMEGLGFGVTAATSGADETTASNNAIAASTEAIADATDDATDSQNKYNKSVLSFDKLHKLGSNNSDSSVSDAADEITDAAKELSNSSTQNAMNKAKTKAQQFADAIKKALQSKNWKQLGNTLADGLINAMKSIDSKIKWDNIKDKVTGAVNAITETLDTFISRKDAFAATGTTIGDAINSLSQTFHLFDQGMNWQDLGDSLGVLFDNAIAAIDWNVMGQNLSAKFMIPWEIFLGFIKEINVDELSDSLYQLIDGAFDRFDSSTIGEGLGTAVTKLSQTIESVLTRDDGEGTIGQRLGQSIIDGLNAFLDAVSWSDVAGAINAVMDTIITGVHTILTDDDTKENIKEGITTLITDIDWADVVTIVAPIIAVNLIKEVITAAFANGVVSTAVKTGFSSLFSGTAASGTATATGASAIAAPAAAAVGVGLVTSAANAKTISKDASSYTKSTSDLAADNAKIARQYGYNGGVYNKGVGDTVNKIFSNQITKTSLKSGVTSAINPMIGYLTTISSAVSAIKNTKTSSSGKIKGYATGGIPDTGSLYFAGENGAEYIGSMGNHNVVANNDQIVSAVSAGVAQAVASVMRSNNTSSNDGEIVLNIDSEELARAVIKGNKKMNIRQNPTVAYS